LKCFSNIYIIKQNQFVLGRGKLKQSKKLRFLRAICIGLFLFSIGIFPVFAQSEAPDTEQAGAEPAEDPITAAERALTLEESAAPAPAPARASSAFAIFRMFLVLVLAAAAIYGLVYIFKRASRRSEVKNPHLKVLASTHLGLNRYAHVLSLGSKAWLVGAAEGGVNLIDEIEDKDILDVLLMEDSQKTAGAAPGRFIDFKTMLRRLGMPVQPGAPGAENIRKRRDRLKGL
jgi:flagellar protein FliO/FliZ